MKHTKIYSEEVVHKGKTLDKLLDKVLNEEEKSTKLLKIKIIRPTTSYEADTWLTDEDISKLLLIAIDDTSWFCKLTGEGGPGPYNFYICKGVISSDIYNYNNNPYISIGAVFWNGGVAGYNFFTLNSNSSPLATRIDKCLQRVGLTMDKYMELILKENE